MPFSLQSLQCSRVLFYFFVVFRNWFERLADTAKADIRAALAHFIYIFIIRVRDHVNISAVQFRKDDFIDSIKTILEEEGAAASSLELEVTESILMHDMESSIQTLNDLRELGFRIAIDDFGTGFSSLNYLRRLPVNVLKIDQSFVREIRCYCYESV